MRRTGGAASYRPENDRIRPGANATIARPCPLPAPDGRPPGGMRRPYASSRSLEPDIRRDGKTGARLHHAAPVQATPSPAANDPSACGSSRGRGGRAVPRRDSHLFLGAGPLWGGESELPPSPTHRIFDGHHPCTASPRPSPGAGGRPRAGRSCAPSPTTFETASTAIPAGLGGGRPSFIPPGAERAPRGSAIGFTRRAAAARLGGASHILP